MREGDSRRSLEATENNLPNEDDVVEYRDLNGKELVGEEDFVEKIEQNILTHELFQGVLNKGDLFDGFFLILHFGLDATYFEEWRKRMWSVMEKWQTDQEIPPYKFNAKKLAETLLSIDPSFFNTEYNNKEIMKKFGAGISLSSIHTWTKDALTRLKQFADPTYKPEPHHKPTKLEQLQKKRATSPPKDPDPHLQHYELEIKKLKQQIDQVVNEKEFVGRTLVYFVLEIEPEPVQVYVVKDLSSNYSSAAMTKTERMSRQEIKMSFYAFPTTPMEENGFKQRLSDQLFEFLLHHP